MHRGRDWDKSITYQDKYLPQAIDLGLSVKWADFNVGATVPTEAGGYYAWGEIEEKSNYGWGTYKWANGWINTLTKYNTLVGNGSVDNKTRLEAEDDVAHVLFHGKWRMPTISELEELINNCDWTYDSGLGGDIVTGPSGASIFLPLAGNKYNTTMSNLGQYG